VQAGSALRACGHAGLPRQRSTELVKSSGRPGGELPRVRSGVGPPAAGRARSPPHQEEGLKAPLRGRGGRCWSGGLRRAGGRYRLDRTGGDPRSWRTLACDGEQARKVHPDRAATGPAGTFTGALPNPSFSWPDADLPRRGSAHPGKRRGQPGGQVIALVTGHAQAGGTTLGPAPRTSGAAHVWRFRDGQAAEFRDCYHGQAAVDACWGQPAAVAG
jgi:hypothetical protein